MAINDNLEIYIKINYSSEKQGKHRINDKHKKTKYKKKHSKEISKYSKTKFLTIIISTKNPNTKKKIILISKWTCVNS